MEKTYKVRFNCFIYQTVETVKVKAGKIISATRGSIANSYWKGKSFKAYLKSISNHESGGFRLLETIQVK